MSRLVSQATLACVLTLAFASAGYGQTATGSIGGTVLDPGGAVIPGASVTATHAQSNQVFETVSSEAGLYVFPSLPTGGYSVAAESAGFKRLTVPNLEVRIATRMALDLTMELGDVAETVEVTGVAPLLETTTSERGENFSKEMMETLPLFTGGIARANSFTRYMAGVNTAAGQVSVNGSGGRGKEILIDGGSLTIPESGGVVFSFPDAEMFQEFKMVTSTYAAEHGRFGGGVEVYSTRSGSNDLHGAAYWNIRRDIFNAAGYNVNSNVNNPAGFRPKQRFNVIGGRLGGPVYVPGVYNGRNKTFWHFTYVSDERPASASGTTSTVPSAAMQQGDFSGIGRSIYDPATTSGDVRQPFANNMIPESRFSSVSRNILPAIPDPNLGGIVSNYSFVNETIIDNYIWSMKFDHSVTDNLRFSYFHTEENNTQDQLRALPGPLGQGLTGTGAKPRHIRINADWIISPTTLMHTAYSYSIRRQIWTNDFQRGFASQIGLPAETDATPRVQFDSADAFTPWGVQDGKVNDGFQNNTTYQFNQAFTMVRGKHEFKFGYDIRRLQTTAEDAAGTNGLYRFARSQTALPTDRGNTGHSFASFLLGAPDSAETSALPIPDVQIRYRYYAGFFQDNWKVAPNLTLNLGMRYEVPIGFFYKNFQYSSFDPTLTNPAVGLPGAMIFPGPGAGRTGETRPYSTDFSSVGPRAGFSWRVGRDTVLRGGYGIYYQTLGNGGCGCTLGFAGAPVAVQSDGLNAALQWDSGIPTPPGFDAPPFIDPTFGNGRNVDYMSPNFGQAPYYQNWSVSLQHTIGKYLIDLGYLGNRGSGLNSTIPFNQVDPKHLALGTLLTRNINDPEVQAAGFSAPYEGFTGSLAQSLRPFPHVLNVQHRNSGDGRVWYDAFQAKMERRFGGTQINANYTYSKSQAKLHFRQIFSQPGPQNAYDLDPEKSISAYDIPHQFNMLGYFDLPFGKGKRFLTSSNRALDLIVGGWQVGLIMQYSSGPALPATTTNTLSNVLFTGIRRADVTGQDIQTGANRTDLDPGDANSPRYLNPNAFAVPDDFAFGNSAYYHRDFRQPPVFRENLAIVKDVTLWNRTDNPVRFIYRADFFNLFNRTNFRVNGSIGNAGFGLPVAPQLGPRIITMGLRVQF